jgi:hypothetical protein
MGGTVKSWSTLDRVPLEPGSQTTAFLDVADTGKSFSILASPWDQGRFRPELLMPNGNRTLFPDFSSSTVITMFPPVTGRYFVTITNVGSQPAAISVVLGHIPATENSTAGILLYGPPVAAAIAAIGGMLAALVGYTMRIIEGRKSRPAGTTKTE